jgi:hypothetical protein
MSSIPDYGWRHFQESRWLTLLGSRSYRTVLANRPPTLRHP